MNRAEEAITATTTTVALGVLLDDSVQQGWVLESLRQALAVPGVSLTALALVRGLSPDTSVATRFHRLLDRVDRQLRCRNEKLFAPVDITSQLLAPQVEIEARRETGGWHPTEAGAETLRRCRADLWLCFTGTPPRRPFPRVSELGVWGMEIGRHVSATDPWAGATEVAARCPVTRLSIVDYAQPGVGQLYRSFGATVGNSVRRSRVASLRKGMSSFSRLLRKLTRNRGAGPGAMSTLPATLDDPIPYPALRAPTVPAVLRLSWNLMAHVAVNRLRVLGGPGQWQIGYYFADSDEVSYRFERLRYLASPPGFLWADPFAVERAGRHFIFFEEMPFRTWRGRIMAIEVLPDGEPAAPQPVLERPYHLSYPFVFCWSGDYYMVPETAQNGTVELYRCEEFPSRWRLERVLLEGIRAYDPTLWKGLDRWWMFVTIAEPGADSSDELHLYWSRTPLGPWTAHPGNPVVSDVRCARPAGPLYSRYGKLYRPSQDCSLAYGHSVCINRVDVLSEYAYRETPVRRILPSWRDDIKRIHTIGGSERLRVLDCRVGGGAW
jgi:hypothetical protein